MERFKELTEKTFQKKQIKVLDVGSYGVNGTYKEMFADTAKYSYTGLDVNPGPNVDYVPADPYLWPELPKESFDVIVSGQAFEHIEYPWLIIEEMSRVLRKNGLIGIVAPSRGPEHKYPVDCWRYYPDAFRALAKWAGLEVIESKTNWGKSGFTDGSDQWGDTFCILTKSTTHHSPVKRVKKNRPISRFTNCNNPLKPSKQNSYYGFARPDVIEAIIKNNLPTGKILEIGCAGGATGKSLKEKLPVESYVGIDISAEAAEIAKQYLDRVIVTDIEQTDLSSEYGLRKNDFNLLMSLDVLEHLLNPWDALADLSTYVKPGGYVVSSLPNIQNISILQDLTDGRWPYQDAGILDATHLRFFTLEEAIKMFTGSGLVIKDIRRVLNPSIDLKTIKKSGNKIHKGKLALDGLTKEDVLNFFTYQYIIVAQKPEVAEKRVECSSMHDTPGRTLLPQFEHKDIILQMTSIVILTYNELSVTKKCVQSIRRHTPEPHEIIFIDNGSTDSTVKWLRNQIQQSQNYRLIENKTNLGFAKGCNQGIEASKGEYILLLNNDVVVADGWLAGLVQCHRYAPDAGIVGPMTNNISGPQQINDDSYRSVDFLDKFAAQFQGKHLHRRIPLRRIVGFCMLFKRTLTEQIGMLDESFGTGNFEDDDYCLRAALAGYKNYIAGDVFIHHYGSRSFIGNKINYGAAISDNRKIIDKKWTLNTTSPEGKKLAVLRAMELANDYYAKGKIDQAVEALINCIKLTPDAKEIYYELARIFVESKKFSEAWEVIGTMPEAAKSDLKGLEYAGYAKEGLGQDDEAAGYVERMLASSTTPTLPRGGGGISEGSSAGEYAPALNLKGVLAYKKGAKEEAVDYFQKAIHADPGYGEAYTNLGVLYWGQDKKDDALAHMKRGFILSPTIPDVSSIYHSIASSLGRFSQAEEAFREACRLYPHHKNLVFLWIDLLLQQGKYDSALLKIEDTLDSFGLDEGTLNAALDVREKIGPLQIETTEKRGTLSLCMIVKNEEKNLVKCLKSVRDFVDELIVVDTGSTDKTKDIARVFGAKVFDFPWTGDFAAARNESLKQATGDWIFILDADEALSSRDFPELKSLIHKPAPRPVAYSIVTRNYTSEVSAIGCTRNTQQYAEEAGIGWLKSTKVRLLTRNKNIFFSNPIHETVESSLRSANIPYFTCNIIVHHYGKLDPDKEARKSDEYYLLGKIKYEKDPTNVKNIRELAKQAEVLHKHDEAIDLWLKILTLIEGKPNSPIYRDLTQLTSIEPLAEIYIHLASDYLLLNRFEEALRAAEKAVDTPDPAKPAVHIYALCEILTGSLQKALAALNKLLADSPDYPPALLFKAAILSLQGDKEKARELYQSLIASRVQIAPVLNKLAAHLHDRGKTNEALVILSDIVQAGVHDEETKQVHARITKEEKMIDDSDNETNAFKKTSPDRISGAQAGGANHTASGSQGQSIAALTSIVILTFNELSVTKECVESIALFTPEDHEIIFIDNGSTDGTVKWLRGLVGKNKHYRLIENGRNLGFSKGCNQGIEASRGEYILLLNNDVVVSENWLSGLHQCHRYAPQAGIIGPMTNNISGPQKVVDEAYQSVKDLEPYCAAFRNQYRHRRIPFSRIVGFCMLFRRSLADEIGFLDESFGTGNFEDDDYCLRAELAGYKNYIAGDVFIHHYRSRSFIANKIDNRAAISGNKSVMDQKWRLSAQSETGKKLAALMAVELADKLYSKGNLDQAVESLVNCIQIAPDEPSIYFNLIRMFLESKKFAEAWAVIGTLPEAAKNQLKALEYTGYVREGLGQDDEAAACADQILTANNSYPQGLNLKGVLAFKTGDREKARGFFLQAIQADPAYGEAYANLGVVAWGEEKQEEAFTNLRRGFVLSPAVPDIHSLYYSLASKLRKFREAEEDFREASRLYSSSKNILFLYIDALISQEKYSQAILEIENALELFGLDEGLLSAALAVREKIGPMQISPEKKNTLSVCMIVKNEEKHLVKCLKSVRDVVDEMIIVDTGSTDKTVDIAKVFGARIFDFPWTGNFSAARNESLKYATGNWILILDADEVLSAQDFPELKALLGKLSVKPVAYSIMTRNYTRNVSVIGWTRNTGVLPEEAGAGWVRSDKVRLFPKDPDIVFANPVHEMVEQSIRSKNIPIQQARIIIHHYGKLDMEKELQKGEQYYLMGKLKYESDPNNVAYVNELAKQAQVLHKYEEAADLWLRLLSLIEGKPDSPGYQAMARISFGEPVPEIYMQLAAAYLMMDRYQEALKAARRGITDKQRPKEYVHIYAHCEIVGGSLENAYSAIEALLDETPDYPPALLMKAIILYLKDDHDQANALFEGLIRKDVLITPVLNQMARHLHAHDKKMEALHIIQAVFENKINDEETKTLLNEFKARDEASVIA